MKLRLPHKLQTAVLTAFASVTFTTVGTATLGAAQDEASTTYIEDTGFEVLEDDLEVSLGEDETPEPDSAPANHAGYNGVHGSSDDADRDLSVSISVSEGGEDTAPAAATVSGQAASVSEVTVSDDLGFTTQVTDGTATAASDTVFLMATAAPAVQQLAVETTAQENNSTGTSSSGTGTSSYGAAPAASAVGGGNVARAPMSFAMFNLGSNVNDSTVGGTSTPSYGYSAARTAAATLSAAGDTPKYATWNFEGNLDGESADIASKTLTGEWKGGGNASYVDTGLYIGWESNDNVIGGNLGKAVTFDGSHYVRVASGKTFSDEGVLPLDTSHAFTVSVWVKLDNANGERFIMGTGDGDTSGFSLALKDGDLDYLAKSQAHHTFADTPDLSTGKWYNFTITSDGTKAYGYVNGVSVGEQSMSGWGFVQGENLGIGSGSANANQSSITGQIASLDIYGKCLSAADIKAQYSVTALDHVDSYTWQGASGNDWNAAVWSLGEKPAQQFQAGSNAVFGANHAGTINVTSTTGTHNASVTGDYTFNLSDDIIFSAYNLDIAESSSATFANDTKTAKVVLNTMHGAGNVVFNNGGETLLLGSSDLTGGVTVANGTVKAMAQNALGTGNITVNGGTLVATVNGSLGTGGVTVNSGGTLELKAHGSMPSIKGTGTVLLATNGNYEYNGNANYMEMFTGTVEVTDHAILQLGSDTSKFAQATLQVNEGGEIRGWKGDTSHRFSHDITLAGGTLAAAGNNMGYKGAFTLTADSTVSATNTTTLEGTVNGDYVLTTSGATVKLAVSGNIGGLKATATNTQIAGALTIDGLTGNEPVNVLSGGNLILSDKVSSIGSALNVNQGGTLTLNNYGEAAASVTGSLTLASGSTLDLTSLILTEETPSYTLATGSNITLNDGANFTLASRYEKTDYILESTGGSLVLTFSPPEEVIWDNATEDGKWTDSANWHKEGATDHIPFANGNKVRFTSDTPSAAPTLGQDAIVSTMTIESGVGVTVGGAYKLTVNKIVGEGATLTLNTSNAQINGAAVVGSLNGTAALNLEAGSSLTVSGAGDSAYSGAISGSGSLTKDGNGTMTVSGNNNNFSGNITVDGGTLKMAHQNALGASNNQGSRTITINTGGTIDINGQDNTIYKYTLSGGSLVNNGGGTNDSHVQNAGIVLTADSSVGGTGRMSMIASGWGATTANLGEKTLTKKDSGTFSFVNTAISKGTIQIDQGTVEFNADKTHSRLSGDIKLNGGTFTGAVQMDDNNNITASVTSNATGNIELTANHTTTLSAENGVTMTLGGQVSGAGSLSIAGNGIVKLTGSNTYSGGTVITGGTLEVSNGSALGNGSVNVRAGTLDLTTTAGTGSLSMAQGGTLKLAGVEGLTVAGNLTLNSGSTLDLSNLAYRSGETVQLATYTGTASYDGVIITLQRPDGSATLSDDGTHLLLTFGILDDLIWAGTEENHTWQDSGVWKFGKTFSSGADVYFDNTASEKEVLVNTGITAGTMTMSDTYTFNVDGSGSLTAANLAGSGALTKTGEGTMTVNGAGANYSGTVSIDEGVLSVTDVSFAAKMLREATGTGTLELNANATLAGGQASRMTGTLRIANSIMLTVGTADGQNNSLASFGSVVLDGGTIKWQSAGGLDNRLQNVTITGNGGTFQIVDINANAVEWTGTTTLQNGNLILLNTQWGGTWNIEKLTGQGNFQNTSTSGNENLTVTIGSIEDYRGNISISNPKTTLTATLNKNANIGTVTRANGGTVNLVAELGAGESASLGGGSVNNLTVNGGTLVVGNNLTATTVSVNNSTITNSGTGSSSLDITTLNVGKNGSIVSGNVSLGSEDAPMAHLHLENTLISKGNNAVYADEVTFVGDLGESVGAGSTFKDTVSGATANGYVESAKVVIVENAAGSLTSNLGDGNHTIIHEGWTYTLQQDEKSNIYISLTASTERAMQGDYYVNSGTVTYGDSGNATGLERTNTLFVNGGNLTFTDTDLKTGVALHVHKDGVVTLGEGRNLNEGAVHVKAGATMTLIGSGTYVLSPAALGARGILPAGTVLAGGFTGTVLVSKDSVLNGTDLSGLVNGTDSRVGFNGATGSLKTGDIVQNIYLQDYGSQVALSLNTGTSGETHTFNGAITGTGTLARSYVTGSGDIGGIQNYEFSGDLNGWTGVFDNQVEGAANTTNLTFSENATVVNAEIKNGVAGSTGLLNVSTTGSEAKQFNKGVTATSFSASGGDVTFNGALRLTGNASAEEDAKLIINNTAMVGGSLSGDVEVTKKGNLTVGGTADLDGLTVDGMASFNGTISTSGAVTVNEGASLYLNGDGIALKDTATLTINSGSMVGLSGWTETKGTPTESGVVKTGFTGGKLFSGNGANVTVETDSYFMKDGAKFLYSGTEDTNNRVLVHTDAGTVDIIDAIYYNVHTGDSTSMDAVQAAAEEEGVTLDYIHIQSGGTLTGVTDENKGSFGISSVQGSGTMAVGAGTLTDSAAFANFTGTIRVDADGTFETDGTITRTITMNGGTLHATDNIDLSQNVTYTAGTTATLDISDGKSVTMTQAVTANLDKRGGGTLHITDTTSGGTRSPMLTGDLHVYDGTAVISSKRHNSDNCGVVNGSITVEQGADLIMEGFDALGHSNNCSEYTKKITLNAGTADNLTTLAFTRNGADPTTLQHTTLSTDIEMNGNTEMSGLRLNAFGTHNENNLGAGAYIHVSGMNNTISNTFAMRYNAYFQVDDNSELALTGNMELFDSQAESKKVIKTGEGVLDFAGDNSTLHAIDIQAGLVEVTGNLTFNGTESTQFLMAKDAQFAVQNGATFNYRGWLFENNDGTHAAGTVTAAGRSTTNILEDSNLVVGGMKLTNNNTGDQAISARLDGVQLMHTGGKVTINNAPTGTQHIATLTIKTGETTLKSATLDAASVYPGATLTFSAGETVELGSTILNGGTVNLAGTINVNDLSAFAPQKGAGFIDKKKHSGASDTYNGFYQGSSYYLIQQEAADSEVTGSKSLTLTYKGTAVKEFKQETDTNSYYFSVTEPSTLYYLNGEADADTTYSASSTGNNMYDGPGDGLYTTGIVMNAAGARLTLATNLRDYVRTITGGSSGIEAKQNGTIDIQSGVTLHQSDLSGDSGVLVSLVGAGTFDLVGTTLKSVSSGLTDGSAWQGTVRASGTADNMNATMMGNVNSTLLLDGVQGTLTNADTRYVMKIELRNGGEGAVTDKALDNTFSTGANRVFSNTVSGSGDILMTGEASGSTQSIAFTGDVSNWTGDFTTATQGTTNLAFNNKAAVINADVMEGAGSTINLSAGPAVDAGGQSAVQVFNGNITASSLTVEAGADTTLDNTTAISGVIDATAANAQLHVQGTTTAQTVQVGNGHVDINDTDGDLMATVTGGSGTAVMDGGLELSSGENLATIKGTTQGQLSTVAGANVKVMSEAASLKLENLVLSDDTFVRGTSGNGNLIISGRVEQQMSTNNTRTKSDTTVTSALTMTGTTGTTMEYDNNKVHNLDFTSMCQLAQISGSAGTLVFDFTGMDGYDDWEHNFSAYGFIGVKFDPAVAMAFKAANQQNEAIYADNLQVVARTTDADGQVVERIGYYNNGGNGVVVGSIVYFQVPEPTTGTLSLLALAALAARRRKH